MPDVPYKWFLSANNFSAVWIILIMVGGGIEGDVELWGDILNDPTAVDLFEQPLYENRLSTTNKLKAMVQPFDYCLHAIRIR